MNKSYKGYFVGLLWFLAASAVLITVGYLTGHATHEAAEQTHKQRMECLDRGGEIKYVTSVGTACVDD